jgi:hypothetical protein
LPQRHRLGFFRVGATSLLLSLSFQLRDPLLSQGAFPLREHCLHLPSRAIGLGAGCQILRLREMVACGSPVLLSVGCASPDQQREHGNEQDDHHHDHDHNGAHGSPSWAPG